MKRCLVFGGAGSIGSELVRQLSKKNKVYVVDINESGLFDLTDSLHSKNVWGRVGDIRDLRTVEDIFEDFKPQIVYNCAAYKHVPLMEYTPLEAIQTNILGHHNIVHTASRWECVENLIYISTDKVVNATSIMGASKKMAEVLTIAKGYTAVRFGNVLGSRGSLLTIWQRQIDNGETLTITDPRMDRYMMTIPEAVALVIEASKFKGNICILDMGEKVNIKQLALEVLGKAGRPLELNEIGIRDGETLTEELMTAEEKQRAFKIGKFYIL